MQTPQNQQHSRRKRLEVRSTGGFWLLVGALLLAAAVHELGHLLAIRALGGRVTRLQLTSLGAVLRTRRAGLCSYREECLVALVGPLASFLLALGAGTWARVFGGADAYLLTGISLALGVFNLLPAGPLDGGGCCGPSPPGWWGRSGAPCSGPGSRGGWVSGCWAWGSGRWPMAGASRCWCAPCGCCGRADGGD